MNLRAPYSPPLPARKTRHRGELHISAMTIRTRKFFGTIALLVLVVVWSYVVAGIGWVLPAMPIISWMARPDA